MSLAMDDGKMRPSVIFTSLARYALIDPLQWFVIIVWLMGRTSCPAAVPECR